MTINKPTVHGEVDGNIFAVMAAASRALRREGLVAESREMIKRITESGSYDEALGIALEYVDLGLNDPDEFEEEETGGY